MRRGAPLREPAQDFRYVWFVAFLQIAGLPRALNFFDEFGGEAVAE
jgi:hypothetical protein